MKQNLLLALVATLAMTIAMTPAVFSQGLVIEPDSIDFGNVPIGITGLPDSFREFTITNQTGADQTIRIRSVNLAFLENFELISPETAEIQPIIRQIFDAAGCYLQDHQDYPFEVVELVEQGYLHIEEEILWRWRFQLVGQDPVTQIWAIKASDHSTVIFDVQTQRFQTYSQENQRIEPVLEFNLSSEESRSFVLSYSPLSPEEIVGWIGFDWEDQQAQLFGSGSGRHNLAIGLSTEAINFGDVYAGKRKVSELGFTNTAEIMIRYEFMFSNWHNFYVFDPELLDIHNYMIIIQQAYLSYRADHQQVARNLNDLVNSGYLVRDSLIIEKWSFYFTGNMTLLARSSDQFELGRGYSVYLKMETGTFRGDGFYIDEYYGQYLGKDRRLNLLVGFAADSIGTFEGDATIKAYPGWSNSFQEFTIHLSGIGLSVADPGNEEVPTTLLLNPAFPNPFNSTTIVSFQTPFSSAVRVSLVDIDGRELKTWIPTSVGMMSEGRFTVDGAGLSAGTYWLKVSQGGQTAQQRVVLVK